MSLTINKKEYKPYVGNIEIYEAYLGDVLVYRNGCTRTKVELKVNNVGNNWSIAYMFNSVGYAKNIYQSASLTFKFVDTNITAGTYTYAAGQQPQWRIYNTDGTLFKSGNGSWGYLSGETGGHTWDANVYISAINNVDTELQTLWLYECEQSL